MPKRNYGFEKRQKELAKIRKREEKQQRRADRGATDPPSEATGNPESGTPDSPGAEP